MKYTVLTGDIVNSTALSAAELDAAMDALHQAARDIATWDRNTPVTAGFARRGGDGWQIAFDRPDWTMRAALFCSATVRRLGDATETRIAIAEGAGTLPPDMDLNAAHGSAFVASGRLLAGMKDRTLIAHAEGGAKSAAFRLADHIVQGWTQSQARAMAEILPPNSGTRAEAAARLGITREAVNQAVWSAGFHAISDALAQMEATP